LLRRLKQIKTYQNDNGEVSPTIVWDTLKAVIRGKRIAKTAAIKRELKKKYVRRKRKNCLKTNDNIKLPVI